MISKDDDDRIAVYETLTEAREQIEALLIGKVLAFDIRGREYAGFLTLAE